VRVSLHALAPSRVLILGPSFARACGRWPSLLGQIERRKSAERQRVAVQGAISHLSRVEVRLLTLLWHLASTWGRVGADGVVVPFGLTHEMLGRFVGAERPTVTLAVGQLADEGHIERLHDGSWLLLNDSEEVLRGALGTVEPLPSAVVRARQVRQSARDPPHAAHAGAGAPADV
jgi:hypothetical protein